MSGVVFTYVPAVLKATLFNIAFATVTSASKRSKITLLVPGIGVASAAI